MEEKERYELQEVFEDGFFYWHLKDNDTKLLKPLNLYNFVDLLNQQDKHIKELEEMNNLLKRSKEHFKKVAENVVDLLGKLNKFIGEPQKRELNYYKVIEHTKSYIEQLKQSQKQLAISELEKIKEFMIAFYGEYSSSVLGNCVNKQIKNLKGEE